VSKLPFADLASARQGTQMNADEGTQMNVPQAAWVKSLAGVMWLIGAALPVCAHDHGEQWALANEYPANSITAESDELFAKLVADATQGKVSIVAMPGGKLGYKSREQLRAVESGQVAMADTFAGAAADSDPLFGLATLPFLAGDVAQARALYAAARPVYEAAFAKRGQKLLYATPWPPSGLWTRTRATSVDAMKSLAVRTYDKTGTDLFTRLGAKAAVVSFNDLPAKLQSGEVNAALSSGDGSAATRLWDVLKHFDEIGYAIPLSFTTVNLDKWEGLDPLTRRRVEAAAARAEETVWRGLEQRNAENHERMRVHGVAIYTAADFDAALPAQLREAARAAWDEWAAQAGPEGAALLAKAIAANRAGAK
jgi:TRAP-type C4-dicarboxylate transport system substrate-binding protein